MLLGYPDWPLSRLIAAAPRVCTRLSACQVLLPYLPLCTAVVHPASLYEAAPEVLSKELELMIVL